MVCYDQWIQQQVVLETHRSLIRGVWIIDPWRFTNAIFKCRSSPYLSSFCMNKFRIKLLHNGSDTLTIEWQPVLTSQSYLDNAILLNMNHWVTLEMTRYDDEYASWTIYNHSRKTYIFVSCMHFLNIMYRNILSTTCFTRSKYGYWNLDNSCSIIIILQHVTYSFHHVSKLIP